MKSPVGRIENKFRFQILLRLKTANADDITKRIYEIADKNQNRNVSVFVEVNPSSLS